MPALITHDTFARDLYFHRFENIGETRDECDAFMLGNQGPDPLFFAVLSPQFFEFTRLGSRLHDRKPAEVLAALKASIDVLPAEDQAVARAYALGFVGHYTLDSTVHPLVFSQQYAVCDAGEPGLDRSSGSEVHAVIESELDELVLFTRRGETIATFDTSRRTLKASDEVLDIVSKMYAYIALTVFGLVIPQDLFAQSVRNDRIVQVALRSPYGVKRAVLGALERLGRPHSMVQAMTLRQIERTESDFDNRERNAWTNPFTFETSTDSFSDLYDQAIDLALENMDAFDKKSFGLEEARALTKERDFSGAPVVAVLTAVEDI